MLLERDGERLRAPRLDYLRPERRIDAPAGLRYENARLGLEGGRARWWLDGPRGELEAARYRLWNSGARGGAGRARLAGQRLRLNGAEYTTCPGPRPAWRLSAGRLDLDPGSNTGRAYNVLLRLGPLPVAWTPYLQFPLGGRKSGLLPPTLDSSSARGEEIVLPLYLNLAPNYDATLTPRYMSRRGLAWEGEFRYLGRTRDGRLEGAWLKRDRQRDTARHRLRWDHRQDLDAGALDLLWEGVSDPDYLRDLGTSLDEANRPYLERHLRLTRRLGPWQGEALLQDYQTLAPDLPDPLRRLPRLRLRGDGTHWRLRAEHSRFQRGDTLAARRTRLAPALTPGYRRPWMSADLTLEGDLLHYPGHAPLALPRLALDTRLYLERRRPATSETLVPRLYWTYTPYRDQDALPLLDTAPLPRGAARLFTPARYAGGDRIGDRHSLTLALDYRRQGRWRQDLRLAALAQLADQRLRLPGEIPARAGQIEPYLQWRGHSPGPWAAFLQAHWADRETRPESAVFGVNYDARDLRARLGYQYDGASANQIESRLWQRWGPWQWGGSLRYDLLAGRDLESLAGIGYGGCCWSLALSARRYRVGPDARLREQLTLSVELTGLGRTGRDLRQRLGL